MNNNLLNVIKEIVAKYGDFILCEPRRVNSLFADLAREEPKPQKNALVKCLEHGFVQTLKSVSAENRGLCKQRLAQKLHDEEGLDLGLCGETLDLLSAVLFGEKQKPKGNFCKNCGKELQEDWKSCPFCSTAVESQSVGSGSGGDGTEPISPADETFSQWQLVRTFEGHEDEVSSVAFSPDSKHILSGTGGLFRSLAFDFTMKLWEAASGQIVRTFEGHKSNVRSVAFSSDGKHIVSGSNDNTVKLWETASGRLIHNFEEPHSYSVTVTPAAFSPNGKHIVSGAGCNLKLWETAGGRLVCIFEGHKEEVLSVAFSSDGRHIVSAGWSGGALTPAADHAIKLWEAASGRLVRTFEGHKEAVRSVAFSPDGKYIVSGSGSIFSELTADTMKLWETASGRLIHTFEGHKKLAFSATFSPDGKHIVSGSDNIMKLWEAASGRPIRAFGDHKGLIYSVAFSSDGKYIVSGSQDKTVKLWGLEEAQ